MTFPLQSVDDQARSLARDLISNCRFAALAYLNKETGAPMVSRIAAIEGPGGGLMSLISDLSHHSSALQQNPLCSLLIGEPGSKGDPLTYPRLSLQATATFVRHGASEHADLAQAFLTKQPKAKLYIGFADFALVRFAPMGAHLNAGFGKAYALSASDVS